MRFVYRGALPLWLVLARPRCRWAWSSSRLAHRWRVVVVGRRALIAALVLPIVWQAAACGA